MYVVATLSYIKHENRNIISEMYTENMGMHTGFGNVNVNVNIGNQIYEYKSSHRTSYMELFQTALDCN